MNILEIKNLHTYFEMKSGTVKAVNGVSFSIEEGKTLAVIGESGSGKSQTALSVLKLFEKNQKMISGEIIFDGRDISSISDKEIRAIRGNEISMIFQEPMTSLNPVYTVKKQIAESLITHRGFTKNNAELEVIKLLESVKIPNPSETANRYPHQLSGGMRQRVMIAIALACNPKLLIADEPTTALDVTIQAQILSLFSELSKARKTAIMFITHDLGIVRQIADEVAVLYCGQLVEQASADIIFSDGNFSHPYTKALLASIPRLSGNKDGRLSAIKGSVPHPLKLPVGCKFAPRCFFADNRCNCEEPPIVEVSANHRIRCFYPDIKRCDDVR